MPNNRNTPESFWARVRKDEDGCWSWTGTILKESGYGQVSWRNKGVRAHRLAYELTYGPIPDGFDVCHECDNPPCCNPDHLFLGTPLKNARDRKRKGRYATGPAHSAAKLTAEQVIQIRALHTEMNQVQLAKHFKVGRTTIRRVLAGEHWALANKDPKDRPLPVIRPRGWNQYSD